MSVDTVPPPAEANAAPVASATAPEVTMADATNATSSSSNAAANGAAETTAGNAAAGSSSFNSSSHQFTLRALVSSKEAGVIIGKAGKNVADLREATGCRAGVSKVVPGVQERVLTVSGSPDGVAKAYAVILQNMADNLSAQPGSNLAGGAPNSISVKLLIANAIMGSVIGKGGATIQALQSKHQSKIITVKEMLPNSTERIVSIEGPLSNVEATLKDLVSILSEQDSSRLTNHILYQPGSNAANTAAAVTSGQLGAGGAPGAYGGAFFGNNAGAGGRYNQNGRRNASGQNGVTRSAGGAAASQAVPTPSNPDLRTQNISIPSDMVGCIIGRGGSKINEIRQQSGAKISIAKDAHDESGERMFTITGTSEALEKALFMLYGQLEGEKEKRIMNQKQETTEA